MTEWIVRWRTGVSGEGWRRVKAQTAFGAVSLVNSELWEKSPHVTWLSVGLASARLDVSTGRFESTAA